MDVRQPDASTSARGRGLAWASFIASLVFPLTYLFVVAEVVIRHQAPAGSSPFVVSLYTIFDYLEWPFPLLAVVLGHLGLARARCTGGWRL